MAGVGQPRPCVSSSRHRRKAECCCGVRYFRSV
nr:MAG TPA: hypothetical protein [Caudoviricetes sp.]